MRRRNGPSRPRQEARATGDAEWVCPRRAEGDPPPWPSACVRRGAGTMCRPDEGSAHLALVRDVGDPERGDDGAQLAHAGGDAVHGGAQVGGEDLAGHQPRGGVGAELVEEGRAAGRSAASSAHGGASRVECTALQVHAASEIPEASQPLAAEDAPLPVKLTGSRAPGRRACRPRARPARPCCSIGLQAPRTRNHDKGEASCLRTGPGCVGGAPKVRISSWSSQSCGAGAHRR